MKLTKENVYINLQGKSKDELTELYDFLISVNELVFNKNFKEYSNRPFKLFLFFDGEDWISCRTEIFLENKTEVTIEQLKEILKPMGTFTPIAMKCTQEQFDAVRPKLNNCKIGYTSDFDFLPYLVNNADSEPLKVYNLNERKNLNKRTVYEEWNEEIFLKACGIEVETLQEKALRLENELKEVKQQIEEENIKLGNWVHNTVENSFYKIGFRPLTTEAEINQCRKITNQELIKLLEQEIK